MTGIEAVPPLPAARAPRLRLGPATAGRCRRRVHLDADPDADRSGRPAPEPGVALRISALVEHRAAVLAALRAAGHEPAVAWSPTDTWRPPLVWSPTLRSGDRIGTPDLLVHDGTGYLPVIVRGHRTLDPGAAAELAPLSDPLHRDTDRSRKPRRHPNDVLQLAHHHRLLVDLGLASTDPAAAGGVVGRGAPAGAPDLDDGAVVVWHRLTPEILADYDGRFAERLRIASAAAARLPALARPLKVAECRRCPWWTRCEVELTASHDVSLLAPGTDADVLRTIGVTTIDELAALPPAATDGLMLSTLAAGEARVRARAWLRGLPLLRRTAQVAVRRADVELDVDMESFGDDGAYLWGTQLSGADVGAPPGYRAFVTWEPLPTRDEGRAFAAFWAYLTSLRRAAADRGLTFAAYCYSRAAEERWLYSTPRRFPDVPGMPTVAQVAEFCASPDWVDMYAEIKSRFVVLGSMRLKALAPLAGFSWRDPEPGGENSMVWYRAAVGADGAPPDPLLAHRLLRYNEDDVLATLALRRWVTDHGHEVPTVRELESTPGFDGTVSEAPSAAPRPTGSPRR